jgi:hypothetical protein
MRNGMHCKREAVSVLLRFPVAEIADDVLRSFGFKAAAFHQLG